MPSWTRVSWRRLTALSLLTSLLFAVAACEGTPRNENWSMFEREQPRTR